MLNINYVKRIVLLIFLLSTVILALSSCGEGKKSFERDGSNILLSTAPDQTGQYREADRDSLVKLGKRIWEREHR